MEIVDLKKEEQKNVEVEGTFVYKYTFTNPISDVFELLLDLPSLLFYSFEETNDSTEDTRLVKYAMLSEEALYKFKIIEQKPNRLIIYDYDFMGTMVGERGRLMLKFHEISNESVKLIVQHQIIDSKSKRWEGEHKKKVAGLPPGYQHLSRNPFNVLEQNWLGMNLDKKLKRQDISKIFVRCKGKRIIVEEGSLAIMQGFTLVLDNLGIIDIKSEVEGLENFTELTDLHLNGNNIKEITGLDKLVNLRNLYLNANKIEWISGLENLSKLERLYLSGNNIQEIEGLENLTNLRILLLNDNKISNIRGMENLAALQHFEIINNPVPEDIIKDLGGYAKSYFGKELDHVRFPQRFVRYCQKPTSEIDLRESERKMEEEALKRKVDEVLRSSQKIRLSMFRNALNLDKSKFDNRILEWTKEFNFTIDGDFLIKLQTAQAPELIMETSWEDKSCPACGKRIVDTQQKICEFCGTEL